MNIGDVVSYKNVEYRIIEWMKAPCEDCEWFYLLEGMNHFICETQLDGEAPCK
jgi:hypothetical protein